MTANLRVIRFKGTGVREYHDLGFCMPLENSVVRVIYTDREIDCASNILDAAAFQVNVKTMLMKAHVRYTVERDVYALRNKVSEFDEASNEVNTDAHAHSLTSYMALWP